jgi:hypothetical protein
VTIAASIAFATAEIVAVRDDDAFNTANPATPRNDQNTGPIGIPDKPVGSFLSAASMAFDFSAGTNGLLPVWK